MYSYSCRKVESDLKNYEKTYIDERGETKAVTYKFKNYNYNYIMGKLIRNITEYVGEEALFIRNFEEYFGPSGHEYAKMKIASYALSDVPAKDRKSYVDLCKEWAKIAKESGYHAKVASTDFISSVENILDSIYRTNKNEFAKCDALDVLAKEDSGHTLVNQENRRLAAACENSIKEDLKRYKINKYENVRKAIALLKKTKFYEEKSSDGLTKIGDRRFIGTKHETFKDLFEDLEDTAKSLSVESVPSKVNPYSNNEESSYVEKIKKLGQLIARLENENDERSRVQSNECSLDVAESEKMDRIRNDIQGKIINLKNIYKELEAKKQSCLKILSYIDAIKKRIGAIDETIKVLDSSANYDLSDVGQVSVFDHTIMMLQKERRKSEEAIKKYSEIIEHMDSLLKRISSIESEIDSLNVGFYELANIGRERKAEGEKNANRSLEEAKLREEALKEEERRKKIEVAKDEVIRSLSQEGHNPDLVFIDMDHCEEKYGEYNKLFRARLMMALNEMNVSYTETDLSNPLDTKYHLMKEKKAEEEQDKVLLDDKGNLRLIRESNGTYLLREQDFLYLYDSFEKKLGVSGIDGYVVVSIMVKDYLNNKYGDLISNWEDIYKFLSDHKKELRGEKTR